MEWKIICMAQKHSSKSLSSPTHTMESQENFRSPQNISGASQQHSIVASPW